MGSREFSILDLSQMCTLAMLAPNYGKWLQMTRKACTPRRYNSAAKPDTRRVIGDVFFAPFHLNAYVLNALSADGAEFDCVLEVARYVITRFGACRLCFLAPRWSVRFE